jgi:siroheme synthase-like protein
MRFLPVGLDLRDRPCIVLGGGPVGTRKVHSLLKAGARVAVVSPEVTPELATEIEAGRVRWTKTPFQPADIEGAHVVVIATDDPEANERAAQVARRQGSLVCDATAGERSDLIFGALLEEDDLTIATFTDGRDPGRARRTRDAIAGWLADPLDGAPPATRDPETSSPMLVLVAHGSRDPEWGRPLEELTTLVGQQTVPERVRLAYSQFATPTLEDVAAEAVDSGIHTLRILPLFMTSGGHVERDIRPVVETIRRAHEDLEVELLPPVGELSSFRKLLVDMAREVIR